MTDLPVRSEVLRRIHADKLLHDDTCIRITEEQSDGRSDRGKGTLTFHLTAPCIGIRLSGNAIPWLNVQKCADAVIFEFRDQGTTLHLVELKSTMKPDEWVKTKDQLRGAYHNALAIAGVLQLGHPGEIRVHVAFTADRVSPVSAPESPILKRPLGKRPSTSVEDWAEGRIELDGLPGIPLNKIPRDTSGNAAVRLT